jgi:hypothetical protein
MTTERYKLFPPRWCSCRIPTSSRGAALAGLTLYSPCRPTAVWAHRAAWMSVRLFGPQALIGRPSTWRPSINDEVWRQLCAAWRNELGAFDTVAAYEPPQRSRPGLAVLLLRRDAPVAFIKAREDGEGWLANEARAHEAVWGARPRSFSIP